MDKTDLLERTRDQLMKIAKSLGLARVSRLKKDELIEAILRDAKRAAEAREKPSRPRATRARANIVARAARRRTEREAEQGRRAAAAESAPRLGEARPEPQASPSAAETSVAVPSATGRAEARRARKTSTSARIARAPAPTTSAAQPPAAPPDRLVLLVRDPEWVFAYWDISDETRKRLRARLGDRAWKGGGFALRLFAVDRGPQASIEVRLEEAATNWYLRVPEAGRTYRAEFGFALSTPAGGSFLALVGSNEVRTPPRATAPAPLVFEEEGWAGEADEGGAGGARTRPGGQRPARPAPAQAAWAPAPARHVPGSGLFGAPAGVASGGWAPAGVASGGFPAAAGVEAAKGFWLRVGTELIVYGATEADAKVTVAGRSIRLRPDGTFTLRFALEDGVREIPVEAVSADGEDRRRITPIVSKETR